METIAITGTPAERAKKIQDYLKANSTPADKIIIMKNGIDAVFLFREHWSDGTVHSQYVLATLADEDENKNVGEAVEYWCHSRGGYFGQDLEGALTALKERG